MYDPVKRAFEIEKIVCQDDKRKYSRFRPARFYGGIATADCVGCSLQCIFCWSYESATKAHMGDLYSPEEVARKLVGIARKKGFQQVRNSGSEPTISRAHLLRVLDLIPKDLQFIIETNGIRIDQKATPPLLQATRISMYECASKGPQAKSFRA